MKRAVLAIFLFSACIEEPEETATTTQFAAYNGGKCPWDDCGQNTPVITDGFFHELNLDRVQNEAGFSIVNTLKDGNSYDLNVVNGRITATLRIGLVGAPTFLAGENLEGAQIRLKRVVAGEPTSYRRLTISSVAKITDYWAKRIDGEPTPKIETYKFFYASETPAANGMTIGTYLCKNGALLAGDPDETRLMPMNHALVFEGDRIDVDSLTLKTENTRWFNIGCAETALAKMQLTGQTRAAQSAGFATTKLMRQTFLKMITGSYCPGGKKFTVAGQPLRWTDTDGTMTIASSVSKRLEARWDSNGATCLNIPRAEENPSSESITQWGYDLDDDIEAECGTIPPCFNNTDPYSLQSYNPI